MGTQNLSKTERIDVRASGPVKQLLQEAARACHKLSLIHISEPTRPY